MSVKERDPLTGHQTTGHEWDGITELNTRVPRAVWFFIIITHVWALIAWLLLPTWPLVSTYTKGLLGLDQRDEVAQKIAAAQQARADWSDQIAMLPVQEILAEPLLMDRVNSTANQLFGDNCAGCHGQDAAGGPGFPSLVDDAWLWGGDPDIVMETLRVGINSDHPDSRYAEMPAFGRDGMLSRDEIRSIVAYLPTLSGAAAGDVSAGAVLFADNCASCHGEKGEGNMDLGAPDLADDFWIYGGDRDALFKTLWDGRQGWMPAWEGRLSETDLKLITTYLQDLREEDRQ
ncbi:cytochrome-c oxidase, cbb3-type subunit III [Sulfitobacter aestuarii]|uniref:Cbb3-type cytochrome c oxidase subunit n=1 Tax=Sulfitobacter aestuarii TaxID=2161676 RepID=A0ABW5U4J5_9RHOB